MTQFYKRLLPALLAALGLLLIGAYFLQPVTLMVDGSPRRLRGWIITAGDALRAAGLAAGPDDRLAPQAGALVPASGQVTLERAHTVSIHTEGLPLTFSTVERIPANLLTRLNIQLYPGDRVLVNGLPVDPVLPLPRANPLYLQYIPARELVVFDGGEAEGRPVFAAAETVGQALWQTGLRLAPGDRTSLPLDEPLTGSQQVNLTRARQVTLETAAGVQQTRTTAATVGQVLAEAGLALQGLDYTLPVESDPIPADGRIRVVRVREELVFQQSTLPYGSSYAPDPNLELDARSVLTPGSLGVKVSRQRVRYEDGQEVDRTTEAEWVAAEPVDQVLGYGTQVVVKTLDTPDGPIEYYRSVSMYATSYAPCKQGLGRCSRSTSSGIPLEKGIVAFTLQMYRMFKFAQVYIPGYGIGTVGDVGGGIPGRLWIDLGYSDEDYQGWAQYVTVYFLTPAPPNPPALLQ